MRGSGPTGVAKVAALGALGDVLGAEGLPAFAVMPMLPRGTAGHHLAEAEKELLIFLVAYFDILGKSSFSGTKVPVKTHAGAKQCPQVNRGNPPLMATASDVS